MGIVISFALSLLLCLVMTPLLMRWADTLGLVDQPDGDRKVHSNPVPRCGGMAIALAVCFPALFWLFDHPELTSFFFATLIIVLFGFLDDRHELNYRWKFFGQILAVLVFFSGDITLTKTPFLGLVDLPSWLNISFWALFILGVTNAVNLSDGLDGLAAGSSLLSLGFIVYLAFVAGEFSLVLIAASTIGALLGFLRFNTHPATVFMGDTGSQFLGFVAACLALMVTQSAQSAVSPLVAIAILGLPILDTLSVILLRIYNGQSPFHPDNRHLHHQLLATGLLHYQAVAALYLLNFLLLLMVYFLRFEADAVVLSSYLLFCIATVSLIGFFRHSAFATRRRLRLDRRERRNLLLRRWVWLYRYGGVWVQYLVGLIWLLCVATAAAPFSAVVGWVAVSAIAVSLLLLFFEAKKSLIQVRISAYFTSAFVVFLVSSDALYSALSWGEEQRQIDVLMLVLLVLLALSIRVTRRAMFRLDTQDVLVLMVLFAAPLIAFGSADNIATTGIVARLALLLYAVEYTINRAKNTAVINVFSMLIFILIGGRYLL